VYLTYEVKVEIRTPSGHDILLTLPFTLQNQPGEALTLARAAEEDPEEFMLKVPAYATIDDELPAYDEVVAPPHDRCACRPGLVPCSIRTAMTL
jgi:hypothetical protein